LKRVLALCGAAAVIAGCGGTSSSPTRFDPTPTVSPASFATVSGCDRSLLPSGYRLDPVHSGKVTAHTYSASADVQAALLYDKLQTGSRQIFLHSSGGKQRADTVASCISLTFPGSDELGRFFGSYRTLRHQAASIVTKLPAAPISGVTSPVAYDETDQSFRGYGVTSTNVVEVAGTAGDTLFIISVSGTHPSRALATNLLKSMVTSS
jgi:hypothetical protein